MYLRAKTRQIWNRSALVDFQELQAEVHFAQNSLGFEDRVLPTRGKQ